LTGSIVADFAAEVELTNWAPEATGRMRVIVNENQIVFATEEARRAVALTQIFDIVQDVASTAQPGASETVSVAFRVGEMREVASITGEVDTLIRFQQVLYRELLNGMEVAVRQHRQGAETSGSPTRQALTVTASQIRFWPPAGDADPAFVVSRDDVTAFKTAKDSFAGEQSQPIVTLFSAGEGPPMKTVVRLPSFRLLNLFGRYLRATLQISDRDRTATRRAGPVEILLVDDDPDDLEMGKLFLEQESDRFDVTTVTSAAGGLEHLAEGASVDCVVSDYDMPGTDGLEFLQAVRERYPDLPFILFTGQGSEAVAKQAILDDVTDYVEKDVGAGQYGVLTERIRRAIS
jgi:CheY-like chemotaxis protein